MPTPAIQTLINDAQQVLNLDSISAVRSVVAVSLANANTGTPLNPNLTTQQLWNEFYQVVPRSKSDIESIIANQLMKFLFSPPAPGGVGANKQVIFNDNGILAGDAGLTYDKATDSLTISGDLTVDTSTLKVDSANNRVGVGTASPAATVSALIGSEFLHFGFGANNDNYYTVGASGTHIWRSSSTEQMRLNATGLGVGTSPTGKLTIGTGAYVAGTLSGTSSLYSTVGQGLVVLADGLVVGTRTGSDRFILDTSGNVGIGVVPSAWVAGAKALQFGAYGALAQSSSGNIELSFNSYNSGAGAYKYLQTDTASLYRASSVHSWFVAPSGTAGNAITFTQAMTLDASGNLILLSSNTPATLTTNGQLTVNATSNTNLRFSYRGSDGVTRVANITLA